MRGILTFFLLGILLSLVSAARCGDGAGQRAAGRPRKFTGLENDPVLRALGDIEDARLGDEIGAAAEAYYSSRFADAHRRISAVMEKYPEPAIGGVLYDFLLLMDGASLGFSGECGRAVETLNRLQTRMENRGDATADDLAGVISLKIDILVAGGDTAAAVNEMDALIARFEDCDAPGVDWRVESAIHNKAAALERDGKLGQAAATYRAYVDKLRSAERPDGATREKLERALRRLEELEREDASEKAAP